MTSSDCAAGDIICTNEDVGDEDVGITMCRISNDAIREAPSISEGTRSNDVSKSKRSKDGTNSDDTCDPEQGEDPARDVTGASHSQRQLYASLSRDGPVYSKGSAQHEDGGCKPCSFYCFSHKGCFRGKSCNFCHMFHSSKSHMKKDGRAQGYKILSPGDQQHHSGEGRINSGESDKNQPRKRVSFEVPETVEASMQEESMSSSLSSSMQYPPSHDAADSDSFSYLPGEVTVSIGQRLELAPLLDGLHPRVFATAPELPPGLMIDKYTGVIHGVPQASIVGTYFVTCCDLLADFKIRTACVHIQCI